MKGYLHINPKIMLKKLDEYVSNEEYDKYERVLGVLSQYLAQGFEKANNKYEFHETLMESINPKDPLKSIHKLLYFMERYKIYYTFFQDVDSTLRDKDIENLENLLNGGLEIELNENTLKKEM